MLEIFCFEIVCLPKLVETPAFFFTFFLGFAKDVLIFVKELRKKVMLFEEKIKYL